MLWGLFQDIMMLFTYMSRDKLWRLKNNKAVGNDGIPSEVNKLHLHEQLMTMMSILFSGCMLIGKQPSTLMPVVIIQLLKCKSRDQADVNNYWSIAIATALSNTERIPCILWMHLAACRFFTLLAALLFLKNSFN